LFEWCLIFILVDICGVKNPCICGTCQNDLSSSQGFRCFCPPGYSGNRCEKCNRYIRLLGGCSIDDFLFSTHLFGQWRRMYKWWWMCSTSNWWLCLLMSLSILWSSLSKSTAIMWRYTIKKIHHIQYLVFISLANSPTATTPSATTISPTCSSNLCNNRGTCQQSGYSTGIQCYCVKGWFGSRCQYGKLNFIFR